MEERPQFLIDAGKQSDGVTYRLHPKTLQHLKDLFPGVTQAPSVFVGYQSKSDFERVHGAMWDQIVSILTGVSLDTIKAYGDVRIHIINTGEFFEVA